MATITSTGTGLWSAAGTWAAIAGTGTISSSTSSTALTGSGTSFTTELAVGSIVLVSGVAVGTIATITDNTNAVFASNAASDNTGAAFTRQIVPNDGDAVVIAAGHTVTFDVDQSGWTTGLAGITVTGVLDFTKTAGTYQMKGKKDVTLMSGGGTVNIGTAGDGNAMPFTAKHTIKPIHGNSYTFDGGSGLTVNIYGTEPSIKYVNLSGNEAKGQTRLEVDRDVRGDIWAVNDTVAICNINNDNEVEYRTISGIAEGYIDISSGLSSSKLAGSYVVLCTRNVTIYTSYYGAFNKFTLANKLNISSCFCNFQNDVTISIFRNTSNQIINGGVYIGSTYCSPFNSNNFITINDGVFIGCTNNGCYNYGVLGSCRLSHISGGLFIGNRYVVGFGSVVVCGGVFVGNNSPFYNTVASITGGTFNFNARDLYATSGISNSIAFSSSIPNYLYASIYNNVFLCVDYGGVSGAIKAWSGGGVVTSQTTTKPDGYVQAYTHALESATYPCFWYKTFTVAAGEEVSVEVQLRKDASMTYLPRVYLMNSIENPLVDATAAEDSFTMTDSTNTWESDTFAIDNSAGTTDKDYTLWFVGKNASGNMYSAYDITTQGGSGGGLLTHPSMTGGMRG